jgi:hypothetical protein
MKTSTQPTRRAIMWRGLWALVLLLHAPITVSVFAAVWRLEEGRAPWSSVLLLAASNAFFVAEICFAFSLRVLRDRRSAAVFLLVVLLIHAGVIERGFPALVAELNQPTGWAVLAVVGAAGAALQACRTASRHVRRTADLAEAAARLARRLFSAKPAEPAPLASRVCAIPYAAHRGPPVC